MKLFRQLRATCYMLWYVHSDYLDAMLPTTEAEPSSLTSSTKTPNQTHRNKISIRRTAALNLAFYSLTYLYGMLWLPCNEEQLDRIWDRNETIASALYRAKVPGCNFVHQMTPSPVWPQYVGVFVAVSTIVIFTLASTLVKGNTIPDRYRLTPGTDPVLDQMHRRWCRNGDGTRSRYLLRSTTVAGCVFLYVNLYLNGLFDRDSFGAWFYWSLPMWPYLYLCVYYMLGVPLYVLLSARIQTRAQRQLVDRFHRLNQAMVSARLAKRTTYDFRYYSEYLTLQKSLLHRCKASQAYGRFWAPYLSVTTAANLILECNLVYVWLYVSDGLPPLLRPVPPIVSVQTALVSGVLHWQCAQVPKTYGALQRASRTFHLRHLRLIVDVDGKSCHHFRRLLKSDQLQVPRQLHPYAFYLFGNCRITIKFFFTIPTYVALLFMYLVKDRAAKTAVGGDHIE